MSTVTLARPSTRPHSAPLSLRSLTIDQAIYSGSNFALAVLGGRSLSQADFGRFALAILAISIMVNLGKAMWHEPDLADGTAGLRPAGSVLIAVAVLTAIISFVVPLLGAVTLATAAAIAQDRARYRALGLGRIGVVLAGDGLWLAILGALVVLELHSPDPARLIAYWAAGAAVGTIVIVLGAQAGSLEASPTTVSLARRRSLFVDNMLSSGMTQIGGIVLALFLTLEDVATLRGAIIVLGPIGIVTGALTTWIFANLDRERPAIDEVARRAVVLAGGSVLLTALIGALPSRIGSELLGSGWPTRGVLLAIGLSVAFQALSTPGMMLFRLTDDRRALLGLRATAFAIFVVLVMGIAAITSSVTTTAIGYAAVNGALALLVWILLVRRSRPDPRMTTNANTPGAATS